jgi:nucleoside-diphosphate-sugar epimerase
MPTSLNVLVTGGSGFIGTTVVAQLLSRGHRVVATTNVVSESLPKRQGLSWVLWDALREPLPHVEWDQFQAILHLAAPERVFDFPAQAVPLYELAIASTFHLLESGYRRGIGRVLIASSGNALGPLRNPATETDALYEPESFYGAAKACSELLARSYQSVISSAVLRFFHPYGPGGQRFLVSRLVKAVCEGREINIEGEDGILLNPIWIEDLAAGVSSAVESDANGIFHFAGPDLLNLRQLVLLIGSLLNKEPRIRVKPPTDFTQHVGTYERSRRILGFEPRVSIREGLRRLIENLRNA